MPAITPKINLYQEEEGYEDTPIGRITTWAVTYGRYIMVGTEIIVLLAFISRFSLDRKLTDLREEIQQKQVILEANQPFEEQFKQLQKKLKNTKVLVVNQNRPERSLNTVQSLLPLDVYLRSYESRPKELNINAVAASTVGFSQFLVNLQSTNVFKEIEVGDISKKPLSGIEFAIIAKLAP